MTSVVATWRRTTILTTIEMLPEDIILEVFDFYRLDAIEQTPGRPWKWHRLAHVCRKWRHIISVSPRRLDLRIFCRKHGAAIRSTLVSWPTLPLVVSFSARPESKHMPRHVMVALRRPERLCEIDLDVTSSMTSLMVETIQKPCQVLERIRIKVQDATRSPILVHNALLGGPAPHLREIKLDGISFPFPKIRQTLLSTSNLVELYLPNIPNDAYFSPHDLVTGLSTLVQLKQLTIGFLAPASSPPPSMTRPPPQRITLPSLAFFDFHGASEYLEEFVAQIDSPPSLCKITIRLFNDIFFEIPHLYQFLPCQNALGSPTSMTVVHSLNSVTIYFSQDSHSSEYILDPCKQLDWQLSFVAQISSQLSPLLSSVRSLTIRCPELPTREDVDPTDWLQLFRPFTQVTEIYIWDRQLVSGVLQALIMPSDDMAPGVLPELELLNLRGYRSPSMVKAAEQFVATRRLSGQIVYLTDYQ